LYDEYGEHIYAYFKRRTDDPRDCTADTFLVAWRRLDRVPEGDAALRWLYGVARKVLLNHWRSRRRFNRLTSKLAEQGEIVSGDPETIVMSRAETSELIAALHRLPNADQEVLRLATWEELPHAAIGEVLGCSAHAVDQRIYRATRRLARELARSGHKRSAGTTPAIEPGDGVT
jgi:RNA polymerase sigma-70 factor (ECF subfamily)